MPGVFFLSDNGSFTFQHHENTGLLGEEVVCFILPAQFVFKRCKTVSNRTAFPLSEGRFLFQNPSFGAGLLIAYSVLASKRTYHPLVMLCFMLGELSDESLNDIPKSTLSYWRNMQDHKNLHGYDWVAHFFDSVVETRAVAERKMGKKVVRLMSRVYCCYDRLIDNMKGYKKTVKAHAHTVIKTIDHLSGTVSLSTACRFLRITTHQYYRLKNKVNCTASVLNLCFRTHPQQLNTKEVSVIKKGLDEPFALSVYRADIYYQLVRSGKLACTLSTFYKYAALLAGNVVREKKPRKWTGFRASKPFEYLHIDTTFVMTEKEGKHRVAFVKDNYSRSILHAKVLPDGSSYPMRELLEETFDLHQLIPPDEHLHIVADGGAENKGEVDRYIAKLGEQVIKLTAKHPEFPHSNSMIESSNHLFKNVFLKYRSIRDGKQLGQQILDFLYWNDHYRYPIDLMGYTPFEVRQGSRPTKSMFTQQIEEARKRRHLENKKAGLCGICQ